MTLPDLLHGLDLAGVFANALLGGAMARRYGFDPVGFGALAIVSGLGGGIIRDTLLQRGTPVALTDYTYLVTALVGAGVAFVLPVRGRAWERSFPFVDALALGCWAATGAQKTLLLGLGWLPAVLLGTVTAVGGGVVRDLCVAQVPRIFGGNTLYATCALLASGVMVAMQVAGLAHSGPLVATLVGAALTLLARWRGWILPEGIDVRRRRRKDRGSDGR
ncbi:trimeric intracellular cation channel family protein [Amycolatopsis taiwanensis]|uniref:Glycine transporter domain-containing protein n=1 Tax=Amycolatopsis taiwanensis TaxID=342230 RepID=A0A9W6R1E6_9PSEU|nr:trimeric intracellular cation channel family protein [Amycolatopsis taiwanensis]GLY66630.1 hypothetical protein Atai01_32490 [Amycolatopsis taiwanensis]